MSLFIQAHTNFLLAPLPPPGPYQEGRSQDPQQDGASGPDDDVPVRLLPGNDLLRRQMPLVGGLERYSRSMSSDSPNQWMARWTQIPRPTSHRTTSRMKSLPMKPSYQCSIVGYQSVGLWGMDVPRSPIRIIGSPSTTGDDPYLKKACELFSWSSFYRAPKRVLSCARRPGPGFKVRPILMQDSLPVASTSRRRRPSPGARCTSPAPPSR